MALKICRAKTAESSKEVAIYEHLYKGAKDFDGSDTIVKLLYHFIHEGSNGFHQCLVFQAMGPSVLHLAEKPSAIQDFRIMEYPDRSTVTFPLWSAKRLMRQLLQALDVLHFHKIAHGDFQTGNLLLFAVRSTLWLESHHN